MNKPLPPCPICGKTAYWYIEDDKCSCWRSNCQGRVRRYRLKDALQGDFSNPIPLRPRKGVIEVWELARFYEGEAQ